MKLFRRRGSATPPGMTLEGVLGPNHRLDEAPARPAPGVTAICAAGGQLLLATGRRIMALETWAAEPLPWAEAAQPVTALAASPGGRIAVGLEGGGLEVRTPDARPVDWSTPEGLAAVNDMLFLGEDEIALVDSGYQTEADVLSRAPWDEVPRGRVVAVPRDGPARDLAGPLHCPMGVALDDRGTPLVTLLERARIVDLDGNERQRGLPGYPGVLRRTGAGYMLACLARRDPLIEFLKQEPAFVAAMKARVDPRHWIAPRRAPEFSHDFPIELGATRLFGEVKPWAPSFSYGLVIELDGSLMPTGAAHSRADGRRHAIADATVWQGRRIVLSRASEELLDLGPAGESA